MRPSLDRKTRLAAERAGASLGGLWKLIEDQFLASAALPTRARCSRPQADVIVRDS